MFKRWLLSGGILAATFLAMPVEAALYDRGNGLIYDDVQDITWLQDGNYAETSGASSSGYMTWYEANEFVDGLVYSGYDDWRLPSVGDVHPFDAMNNNQDPVPGEMQHIFWSDLDRTEGQSICGFIPESSCNAKFVDAGTGEVTSFFNMEPDVYWYAEAIPPEISGGLWTDALIFLADIGWNENLSKWQTGLVWAVRDGDVIELRPVIEAESMALSGGYAVEDNAAASGGQLIRRLASGGYAATASTEYTGAAGNYDIAVSYFDEYDGMSRLAFLLNGEMLDQWIADEDPACRECASPNESTLRSRVVARNIRLSPGDEIALQGTGEHYEYARFDKITVAPVSSNIIEAEKMTLEGGYAVEDNLAASSGQLIRRRDSGGYAATASAQYTGPAGSYDIAVSYFDEYDGMSSLAFLLNGEMLDQWIADEDPACRECASPNETTLRSRVVARNVRLSTGDEIALQGTGEHYEYARFDKITFYTLEPLPQSPVVFDDGGVHNIDYPISSEEVHLKNGTTLNILAGAKLQRLVTFESDPPSNFTNVLNVYDGKIDSILGDGDAWSSENFNIHIYGGSISSIDIRGGTVEIGDGNIGSLTTFLPSLTISGGVFGDFHAKTLAGTLTITGGTFLEKVDITSDYSGYTIAISGGTFNGDFNIFGPAPSLVVFHGELELVLLSQWVEEYMSFAEYSIEGALRDDGSPLSTSIFCSSLRWGEGGPCPWVSITVEP